MSDKALGMRRAGAAYETIAKELGYVNTESVVRDIQARLAHDEGVSELDQDGNPLPTIGKIVWYSSAIGDGVVSPAMVLRTRKTTIPEIINRWGPEPQRLQSAVDPSVTHETAARPDSLVAELPDDLTIDLIVHGLGKDYREYAVPHDPGGSPRSWRWPDRV